MRRGALCAVRRPQWGYWLLRIDYWLLTIGCCLLAVGYCLLAIGYWLLAIGYWLLAIGGQGVFNNPLTRPRPPTLMPPASFRRRCSGSAFACRIGESTRHRCASASLGRLQIALPQRITSPSGGQRLAGCLTLTRRPRVFEGARGRALGGVSLTPVLDSGELGARGRSTFSLRQSAMHNKQRRHGVTGPDNALGGSYYHLQHGSRPRVPDQQLFTCMAMQYAHGMLTASTAHPTSLSRARPGPGPTGSEVTTDYVAAHQVLGLWNSPQEQRPAALWV